MDMKCNKCYANKKGNCSCYKCIHNSPPDCRCSPGWDKRKWQLRSYQYNGDEYKTMPVKYCIKFELDWIRIIKYKYKEEI